ncbi:MAG: hypothetical protein ACRERD_04650, partial [Candidatus Binatia bacterium]
IRPILKGVAGSPRLPRLDSAAPAKYCLAGFCERGWTVLRFLFGLLLGAIIGIGGTTYFFSSGGGDYLLASSQRVQRLEEDLRRAEQGRELTAKKLGGATALLEKMTGKFTDLERRFQTLESASPPPTASPPATEATTPADTSNEVTGP